MKAYRVYVKMPGAKRFKPYGGDGLMVSRLIHAPIYETRTELEDLELYEWRDEMQAKHGGRWELRCVKGWDDIGQGH